MVAWVGKPDGPEWYAPEYHEIFLYDGASTVRLTHNVFEHANPQINDNVHVVWHGYDGQDFEIFLYDCTAVAQPAISNQRWELPQRFERIGGNAAG